MTVVYINITLVYINITLVYIYDFSVHVWLCGHVMKRQHSHIVKYAVFQKKKKHTREMLYKMIRKICRGKKYMRQLKD